MFTPEYIGSWKYPSLFCTDVHSPEYTLYKGWVQELVQAEPLANRDQAILIIIQAYLSFSTNGKLN